jgi:hypothetical protein
MLPHLTTSEASKYYSVLIYLLNLFSSTNLFPAATPRLPLITPPKRLNTTPKWLSITLPRSTQPQLRRPSITQSQLATQKLLFRTTSNGNTTVMLHFTSPRPTLHLATTPQPQVLHRKSRPLHNHIRCLVYHIEEFKYYPAPNYYHLRFICISPAILLTMSPLLMLLLYIEVLKYFSGCVERLLK